jgi:hypothetical protein
MDRSWHRVYPRQKTRLERAACSFLGFEGQGDIRQRAGRRRAKLGQHRAGARMVGRLRTTTLFAPVVAGERGVNGSRVRIIDTVVHRPHERRAVHELGQAGKVLRELYARQRCGDRTKLTANLHGRIRLQIPHIEVTGSAVEIDDDAAVGFAGPAAGLLGLQNLRQRQPKRSDAADTQQFAARESTCG